MFVEFTLVSKLILAVLVTIAQQDGRKTPTFPLTDKYPISSISDPKILTSSNLKRTANIIKLPFLV